jgi:hypothetical protein
MPAKHRSSAPTPSGSRVRPYEAATQTPGTLKKQQVEFARAEELRQMLLNLGKVDDEGRRTSLLDTLCSIEDVLNLPEHLNPPSIASGELRVDLMRHQVCDHPIIQEVYRCSTSCLHIHRNKHCSGPLSTKIQNFRRRKRISLCSSGSTERQAPRCVVVP